MTDNQPSEATVERVRGCVYGGLQVVLIVGAVAVAFLAPERWMIVAVAMLLIAQRGHMIEHLDRRFPETKGRGVR